MKPTYEIAMAAGRDAGNHLMKENHRTAWNLDDWNASCGVFEQVIAIVDRAERTVSTTTKPRSGQLSASKGHSG